ncbi:hypothetical protein [Cellulosimicrobium marinum]|uniref:hypothetical protein n=1 Tax=Cellulosimicrobium marinum TaxID=1638992 RepID=UPI001E5386FE|nr:hypothetical protein [Cellulosimicrobium marinum]MCB7135209.1 hypothetical protein [Cellulosimicrobium marinum]
MLWIAVGALLVVSGVAVTATAVRSTPRDRSTGANGLAIACGAGLAVWGAVALGVALVVRS